MDVNHENTIPSTTGTTFLQSCTHTSFLDATVPRITLVALSISRTLGIRCLCIYQSVTLFVFFFSDQAQKRVYRKRVGQDNPWLASTHDPAQTTHWHHQIHITTIKGYISAKAADHLQYVRLPRDLEAKPALSRTSPYTGKETKTTRVRT